MAFFKRVTTETKDLAKQNVVIMGRLTWDSLPKRFQPLPNRINIVISTTLSEVPDSVYVARSFDDAIGLLASVDVSQKMEQVYVIGGSSVYKAALESGLCHRIYLTQVLKEFQCDAFLPEFDLNDYDHVDDPSVGSELQTDDATGVQYRFIVYQQKLRGDAD